MNKIFTTAKTWHYKFANLISYLQSPFLLFVRLYWGIQLTQSGWGKLHHLANVTEFFTSLGLPAPGFTALAISCLEFFGGILFALGFFSRPLALVLTINMLMAYFTADREALLSIFSDPDKFYAAAPYTFLVASVIVLLFGSGYFSLDNLFARIFGWFDPTPTNSAPTRV
ncbi:MAG: DoxX family protein [Candidatus Acidiferrum sp.]